MNAYESGRGAWRFQRRVASTLFALLRRVIPRSDERRDVAWKALLEEVHCNLVHATDALLAGLR